MNATISDLIQRGLECHRAGQIGTAKTYYDQALEIDPRHPDALHLSGLVALQGGLIDLAVERLRKAVQAQPRNPMFRGNLASALMSGGLIDEARAAFQRASKLKPDEPQYLVGAANCLAMRKQFDKAEAILRGITQRFPNSSLAWFNLANAVRDQNRGREAIEIYERAIAIAPGEIEPYINLGGVLLSLGKLDSADATYRKALALNPNDPRLICNLASVLIDRGLFTEAEAACRRALEIDHTLVVARTFLGAALSHQGRLVEALDFHRQAALLESDNARAQVGYGAALFEAGHTAEAVPVLERAIALAPDRWQPRVSLGNANLALGDFRKGWQGYARRVDGMNLEKLYPGISPAASIPHDLAGKHLCILNEQGLGDQLFFLRFAEELKRRGARITCRSNGKIAGLVGRVPAIDSVVADTDPIPAADFHVLAGDLPRLLDHGEPGSVDRPNSSVPASLKIAPLAENLKRISAQLAGFSRPPYVGLTWRGGVAPAEQKGGMAWNLFKQVPIAQLADTLRGVNANFVILQRNPAPGEIDQLSALLGKPLCDLSPLNEDLESMLALLALIDDYVGVSNTNMHLRAAIGRTARVLVPCPPEWRWLASGDESPWFPGFGVYRQKTDGDWSTALALLSDHLRVAFPPRAP